MLTQLTPEQVSKFWSIIKYAVEQSLPPIVGEHPDKMNRLLSAILSGRLEVWASYTRSEEAVKFEAILVTQILYDDASNTKNLLLYCVYGYTVITSSSWLEGFKAVSKYAKSLGCSKIIAYTANENVVELAKKFNADTSFTFISIPVNESVLE